MVIELIPKKAITTADVTILRSISACSILEIKRAASMGTPVRSFHIFGKNWESERNELVEIYKLYSQSPVPFIVSDSEPGETLDPEDLYSRFLLWRSIELETQKNTDLECGYINNLEEFVPHDDDWI
jgi:hypothetical protein